jgi:hypothetical protein
MIFNPNAAAAEIARARGNPSAIPASANSLYQKIKPSTKG